MNVLGNLLEWSYHLLKRGFYTFEERKELSDLTSEVATVSRPQSKQPFFDLFNHDQRNYIVFRGKTVCFKLPDERRYRDLQTGDQVILYFQTQITRTFDYVDPDYENKQLVDTSTEDIFVSTSKI